jgi:hypothetical protein
VFVSGLDFWPAGRAQGDDFPWKARYRVGSISYLGPEGGNRYAALVYSVLPYGGKPHLRLAVPCGSREEALAVIEEQARAELAHLRARRNFVRFGGPLAPPRG